MFLAIVKLLRSIEILQLLEMLEFHVTGAETNAARPIKTIGYGINISFHVNQQKSQTLFHQNHLHFRVE